MLRTIIYVNVYILLDFPITHRNDSAFLQSEHACLHVNSKHGSFFAISNENTYPKGRALVQMYRAVPITERGNPKNWFKVKGEN